jgi:predicted dienelactone hydrolase
MLAFVRLSREHERTLQFLRAQFAVLPFDERAAIGRTEQTTGIDPRRGPYDHQPDETAASVINRQPHEGKFAMRGSSNSVFLAVASALALLVATSSCGSEGKGSAAYSSAGAGGSISDLAAGAAGVTAGQNAGATAVKYDPDAPGTKPGAYKVGHVSYMLEDSAVYGRRVAVNVWYPADAATLTTDPARYSLTDPFSSYGTPNSLSTDWEALGYDAVYEEPTPAASGPFPLVMVAPGFNSDNWQYLYIGTRLASHGFVVAVTEHDHSGQSPANPADSAAVSAYNWTRDISFAITALLRKHDNAGEKLHGIIDSSKIALSGHSFGGYATYALAGGDDVVCDTLWFAHYGGEALPYPESTCAPVAPDPRVGAIATLDGASQFLRYHELHRISVPSLIIGETVEHTASYNGSLPSDLDIGRWIARPHAAINRTDSYRVDVTTANHTSFSNFCDGLRIILGSGATWAKSLFDTYCVAVDTYDPANDEATHQIVTTYMLAFLNTVFGREDDSGMLTAGYATQKQPSVEFFASETCGAALPDATSYTYVTHAGQCQTAEQDPATYFVTASTSPIPGFHIQAQGYVVSGAWGGYAYTSVSPAETPTTTISPADFTSMTSGATELCVQGTVGAVLDSASIGVNVNQTEAAPDGGTSSVQTKAIGGDGITVQYSNPGGSVLLVQIQTPNGTADATGRWCANLSGLGGTETIPWAGFWGGVADGTKDCRVAGGGGINPPVGTEISAVSLYVPGSTAAVPYNFCLQGIGQAP